MNPESAKGKKQLSEAIEVLNKVWVDMESASKKTSAVIDKSSTVVKTTALFAKTLLDCQKALKAVDIEKDDLGYFLKFRESKAGVPMSVGSAQAASHSAAAKTGPLLETAKALKALFPAKDA